MVCATILAALAALTFILVAILAAAGALSPRIRAILGGADDAPFHGERVPLDFVPVLEKITAKPIPAPPQTVKDLTLAPPYQSASLRLNPVLSYGQRKLLVAEVGFLTRYGDLSKDVVYVGAAPGTHIPHLAHLFPQHRFVLYDSGDFFMPGPPEARARITTRQRYFTDEDARALAGRGVLFISDIRTGITDAEASVRVMGDMERQRKWVETARPAASSLKFRLPWEPGATQYFGGELRVQAWAPKATNETRLEFAGVPARVAWDHEKYDRRLHFLNEGLRQWGFFAGADGPPLPAGVPGVDHCFDCASEIATWRGYLDRRESQDPPLETVAALMNAATAAIGQRLDVAPHGLEPETPMVSKRGQLIADCRAGRFPCRALARTKSRRRKKFAQRRRKKFAQRRAPSPKND